VILGIGVDLVEVNRMERALSSSWATRLIHRVFSVEEADICTSSARPAERFAARFAAKEAFAKAIGTGFSRGVTPAQVTVKGGEREQPTIVLGGNALAIARSLGVERVHLSLSHTSRTACAYVVLEGKG